jgi:hypothetical protein
VTEQYAHELPNIVFEQVNHLLVVNAGAGSQNARTGALNKLVAGVEALVFAAFGADAGSGPSFPRFVAY